MIDRWLRMSQARAIAQVSRPTMRKWCEELMGHGSIRSTQIYAHLNSDAMEAGLAALGGGE